MPTKLTLDEFIRRSTLVHGDKYDYSKVVYVEMHVKVEIVCHKHGTYWKEPNSHIRGKSGCTQCGLDEQWLGNDEFIRRSKETHGDYYDYSLVEYKGVRKKVIIVCPIHDRFAQQSKIHMEGSGCKPCGRKSSGLITSKSKENFIDFGSNENPYALAWG